MSLSSLVEAGCAPDCAAEMGSGAGATDAVRVVAVASEGFALERGALGFAVTAALEVARERTGEAVALLLLLTPRQRAVTGELATERLRINAVVDVAPAVGARERAVAEGVEEVDTVVERARLEEEEVGGRGTLLPAAVVGRCGSAVVLERTREAEAAVGGRETVGAAAALVTACVAARGRDDGVEAVAVAGAAGVLFAAGRNGTFDGRLAALAVGSAAVVERVVLVVACGTRLGICDGFVVVAIAAKAVSRT